MIFLFYFLVNTKLTLYPLHVRYMLHEVTPIYSVLNLLITELTFQRNPNHWTFYYPFLTLDTLGRKYRSFHAIRSYVTQYFDSFCLV